MNDKLLRQDVIDELDFEPRVESVNIGVTVDGGVVTLTGHVPNYSQKCAAEEAVKRVKGVRGIAEELKVQFADTEGTPVHRAQHLNVADWVEFMPLGNSVLNQFHKGCSDLLRRVPLNEMEVGAKLRCAKFWHLPLSDEVCAGDDFAGGRLPKHFGQANDRYHAAINEVT